MSHRPAKNRSTLWAFALCAASVGGLWYAWTQSETGQAAASLPNELETARRAGLPTTPDELRAQIRQKKGTNAANDYLAAFSYAKASARKHLGKYDLAKFLRGKASAGEVADLKADIRRVKPALTDLEAGARKDLLDYNRPWENGFMILFPDLGDTRNLVNVLCLRALYQPETRKSLPLAARVARQVGEEPTTIAKFVQARLEQMTIDTLHRLLRENPNDPELHRIGRETLAAFGPFPSMRNTFGGELVMYRVGTQQMSPKIVEELAMAGVKLDLPPQSIAMLRFPAVRRATEATMVRFWREMAEGVPKDPEDIQGLRTAMTAVESHYGNRERTDHALLAALGLFRGGFADAMGEALVRRRLLAGTLDGLEARAKTGAFPKTLEIGDPFATSMVYKPSAKGFSLYSVGPDGQDNGGKPKVKDETVYDVGVQIVAGR